MIRLVLLSLAAAALLLACPKNTGGPNLGGSDAEKMDMLAAQLEEYGTKPAASCSDTCGLKGKVCDISEKACEIAGRNADRNDFQRRCVTAQEECARFNEACSTCK